MNQALVQDVVSEVMRRLNTSSAVANSPHATRAGSTAPTRVPFAKPQATITGADGRFGIFPKIDDAVSAATESQKRLARLSLDERDSIVKLIKSIAKKNAQDWGRLELEETKIGRLDHKVEKLEILDRVPGVEFLRTEAASGSSGLNLDEYAPFGVIGAITPVTHSVPTLSANAINMVAAGNAIVFNTHPSGTNCAAHATREYNKAIAAKFGIDGLLSMVVPPTLETAD